MKEYNYFRFGSKNSRDCDIMCIIDELKLLSFQERKELAFEIEQKLGENNDLDYDVNLCSIDDGTVNEVYKGTTDEVNNSIFTTFDNHIENEGKSCPILRLVDRDVLLKVQRCIRIILSFCSRTSHRSIIKPMLKQPLNDQLKFLDDYTLDGIKNFNKKNQTDEEIKYMIRYQLCQTIWLLKGIEHYDKSEILYGGFEKLSLDELKKQFLELVNVK